MGNSQQKRLIFADYLRGIAATMVLMAHYIYSFWIVGNLYANTVNYPLWAAQMPHFFKSLILFDAFPGFLGVFGVSIFFLISGFVIAFSLDNKDFKSFWISRFFRLVPTYIFVFLINMIIVLLATLLTHSTFPHSILEVLTNCFMGLPNLLVNCKILDFVAWTLMIEFAYYLLTSILNTKSKISIKTLFYIDLICIIGIEFARILTNFIGNYINTDFIVKIFALVLFMCLGFVIYLYWSKKINVNKFMAVTLFQLTYFLVVYRGNINRINWANENEYFTWFLLAFFLFFSCFLFNDKLPQIKQLKWLGDISYPLYLIHSYTGFFVINFLAYHKVPIYLAIVASLIIVFISANFVHKYIELSSNNLGKSFIKKEQK